MNICEHCYLSNTFTHLWSQDNAQETETEWIEKVGKTSPLLNVVKNKQHPKGMIKKGIMGGLERHTVTCQQTRKGNAV